MSPERRAKLTIINSPTFLSVEAYQALQGLQAIRHTTYPQPPIGMPDRLSIDHEKWSAQAYVEQARQVNRSVPLLAEDYESRRVIRRHANWLSAKFIAQSYARLQDLDVKPDELYPFLGITLHYIVSAPQAAADHHLREVRATIFESCLARLGRLAMTKDTNSLAESVKAADAVFRALTYQTPFPSFHQIHRDEQQELVQAVGNEWLELCELIHQAAPGLLTTRSNYTPALAYLSVHDLRVSIAAEPERREALCKSFLKTPWTFGAPPAPELEPIDLDSSG